MKNYFDPAVYRERGELPPFFAGLLPEGSLRRRLLATRKSARDMDDFGILAAAGEDLPGAVTVVPANLDKLTAVARAYGVGGAIHMEDACQLLTLMPGQKYSGAKQLVKFLQVLDRLGANGTDDVRQFFIRQTVNTLLGNLDAHLKNFSVLYRDGVRPVLSPAYDIVCVAALPGFQGFATNAAIDKLQRQETLDTYATIARQAGISERIAKAAVAHTVMLARDLWPRALREMEMPDAVRLQIEDRLNTLPLAGGASA